VPLNSAARRALQLYLKGREPVREEDHLFLSERRGQPLSLRTIQGGGWTAERPLLHSQWNVRFFGLLTPPLTMRSIRYSQKTAFCARESHMAGSSRPSIDFPETLIRVGIAPGTELRFTAPDYYQDSMTPEGPRFGFWRSCSRH
jgi:hypothetical protein